MGQIHLNNCLHLSNARLIAVADVSKHSLRRAKKLGVPQTYEDYNDLLIKSDVDAVIIALPTHLHFDSTLAAIENHKHVLLEKPIARNTQEGRALVSASNKNDTKLMIGYPLRFSDAYQTLRSKILDGELGDIQIAYATNIGTGPFVHRAETGAPSPVPDWWWSKELTGGGALIDLGSHMIDLARWYFGDVVTVQSYLGHRLNLPQEDHAICIMKFAENQTCVISVGWFSQQAQNNIEVFGTAGHANTFQRKQRKVKTVFQLLLRKTSSLNKPYLKEIQYFVNCLETDEKPQPSAESGLSDLEIVEKAYSNQLRIV